MFSLPCGELSAEPRSSPANRSPAARFDLARSSGATGLDLDEQNAAYVALPRLSTVGDPMPRGFQLAGSGVGRLPGRPGHAYARSRTTRGTAPGFNDEEAVMSTNGQIAAGV